MASSRNRAGRCRFPSWYAASAHSRVVRGLASSTSSGAATTTTATPLSTWMTSPSWSSSPRGSETMSSRFPLDRTRKCARSRSAAVNSTSSTASAGGVSWANFPSTAATTGTSGVVIARPASPSAQVVELGQWECLCGLDGDALSVHEDVVGFGVDPDLRQRVVPHHVALPDGPGSLDWKQRLGLDLIGQPRVDCGLGDERVREPPTIAPEVPPLGAVLERLRRHERRGGVAHCRPGNESSLQDQFRLRDEVVRSPKDDVGHLARRY